MTDIISGCKAIYGCEKKEQCERYRLSKEVTGYKGFAAFQLCRNSEFLAKHYEHFVEITYLVKPCPFCGLQMEDSDLDDALHPRREGDWLINCLECAGGCGVKMLGDTEQEVIEKWNRRS